MKPFIVLLLGFFTNYIQAQTLQFRNFSRHYKLAVRDALNIPDIGTNAANSRKVYPSTYHNSTTMNNNIFNRLLNNIPPVVNTSAGETKYVLPAIIIDGSVTLSDADNVTLSSAIIRISVNFKPEDKLYFFNTSTATFGNISKTYDPASGVLSLSSAGATATLTQWQNALKSIEYGNVNFSATRSTSTRTVSFEINDGIAISNTATKQVSVAPYNAPPEINNVSPATSNFVEGNNVPSSPVVIYPSINLTDPDGNSTFSLVSVHISYSQSGDPADALAFTNDGVNMGNISGNYNNTFLQLTSAGNTATLPQWQAALRKVTFTNTSNSPLTSSRIIDIVGTDTLGSTVFGPSKYVSVTAINDSPVVVTSSGSTSFIYTTSASIPAIVDNAVNVTDLDNSTLSYANVSVTSNFITAKDILSFTPNAAATGNITATYNASSGVLTLSSAGASATVAQWQAALRSVTYTSSSSQGSSQKTVSFLVNDGTSNSNVAVKQIAIQDAVITFSGKVYLQGAYNTVSGTMNNSLNSLGILQAKAASQPYNNPSFNYAGNENVDGSFFDAHPDIIDWVLIELRKSSDASVVLAARAIFVKDNGTLCDTGGISTQIIFRGIAPGNYFVSVRHRNHLGIRSAATLSFNSGAANYDFTTAANKCYQSMAYNSTVQTGTVWSMRGGNANSNSTVKYNGPENDQDRIINGVLGGSISTILSNQYSPEDVNMDGTIKANGPGNDPNFLLNTALGGLLSTIYFEQL